MSNREIKFRAWDTTNKIMECDLDTEKWREHPGLNDDIRLMQQGGYVLMQYTGLKDKNGKEIYEGDVVTNPISKSTDQVEWYAPSCGFEPFSDSQWNGRRRDGGGLNPEEVEVIGNIYENLELINLND